MILAKIPVLKEQANLSRFNFDWASYSGGYIIFCNHKF